MYMLNNIQLALAIGIAKVVTFIVKFFKLGAASVLPGAISLRFYPKTLSELCKQVTEGIIVVIGTNGKTTTSLLLRTILENQGWRVTHNRTGANLLNGLVTALLENTTITGNLVTDFAILEVDENIISLLLKECKPKIIIGLNIFRDQLDRYGEVDSISLAWQKAISSLSPETTIILNADDPTLSHLGQQLFQQTFYFGLSEPEQYLEEIPHAADSIYCPSCGHILSYQGFYLSHLGDFHCPRCNFKKSQLALISKDWPQILVGIYNKYNTLAAGLAARKLGVQFPEICNTIKTFKPAFGRAEELIVDNKKVCILLSKNPVGMNETIKIVNNSKKEKHSSTTLLILNDRIPDGIDISWIWDVDTELLVRLGGNLIVSGDRTYDMALRLKYSQQSLTSQENTINLIVKENLNQAIKMALSLTTEAETLYIIPTYSAMLEVREIIVGRKIL
ncbi:Mur ligase family protein [Candidatus Atelocyanobacterium thalassae]|nr:Mur ligase family protein [Candidatus Atelocyanobacterium thalassa]